MHRLALMAAAIASALLFIGTADGASVTRTDGAWSARTDVRQRGVVVAWVTGGGAIGDRYWTYCGNKETNAWDGPGGRLVVALWRADRLTYDDLGWAIRVDANTWKVSGNPAIGYPARVGRVVRQSPSRWTVFRAANPRPVAQAVGRDGVAAGASFLLHGSCR